MKSVQRFLTLFVITSVVLGSVPSVAATLLSQSDLTQPNGDAVVTSENVQTTSSQWTPQTDGDANATVVNQTALDFRVYKCSYANATRDLGSQNGSLTISFSYNITQDEFWEVAFVEIYEDGQLIERNTSFPQERSSTITGQFERTVSVDGDVSVTMGITPSNFCSNSDHANTYFEATNIAFDRPNASDSQSSNDSSGSSTAGDPISFDVSNTTTARNSTVTVKFNLTNTNDTSLSGPAVKVTDYPSNWTIASHEDAGSTYSDSSGIPTWLFLSVSAGASKQPTMTFNVPNSTESGDYTVTGQAQTADGFTVNASATVTVSESGARTIEDEIAGEDESIGIVDIQRAIRLWANDKAVPNTGGKTIGIVKIQSLIQQWASSS